MHLSLRQLQIFVAVTEAGTTTAAGARIALSQSAVSAALAELEALLGTALFDRVGRRLQLNENGRALLEPARELLHAAADIERRFGVGQGGAARMPVQLRVGASTTIGNYLLPQRMAALLAGNRHAQVDLRIGNSREIVAAVRQLEVDIGLIEGPCHEPGLQVVPWRQDELVIVCGRDFPLPEGGREAVDIAVLRRARWLLREPGSGTREAAEQALLPHLRRFASVIRLGGTEAIKQAAVAGLGLACLSRHAVADLLALDRLRCLPTTLPPLSRQLWVVRHPGKRLSDSVLQLLELPAAAFVQE